MIGVSDDVLYKIDDLTQEEYDEIKEHINYSVKILEDIKQLKDVVEIIKCHHENYDGSGYPYGMHGEELPEMVRIISAADALDAMNSNRCYRKHCDRDYIIGEFRKGAGKQFDAGVAQAVVALIEEGRITV